MKTVRVAQKGFTLIELMIVIAIVGILAAIALPAYQDYTVRAKMSEPMAALSEAKTTLTEYYSSNNSLPTVVESGINTNPNKDIVKSLKLATNGGFLITATVQDGIIPGAAADAGFSLSGVTTAGDGSILWVCKQSRRVTGTTAIQPKYLPSNCRT